MGQTIENTITLNRTTVKEESKGALPNLELFKVSLSKLPNKLQEYIIEKAKICQPDSIYVCDGSQEEYNSLLNLLVKDGWITKLEKMQNCYLALTDPRDVARVESRTFISTKNRLDTIPTPKHGFTSPPPENHLDSMLCSPLGNWMSPDDCQKELNKRLPGCMKGRTMYVIPYSMGLSNVNGSESLISKIGIELTDSPYVVCSMRIMTRMGIKILRTFKDESLFVKCLHSVGVPLPTGREIVNNWPCNPEYTMIAHLVDQNEVISFGSGYGGNSLLGKKCFALRLGSKIAQREGWLAEHMLILGLTNPEGKKIYITGAFPSQCGKTNLAMMSPSLPNWKIEVVGDDIAWLRFDSNGVLRAINPENGFFGVCPGTSEKTNPVALKSIQYNTIFTNVAHTLDGKVYWEGLDDKLVSEGQHLISWKGKDWTKDSKDLAAHPNSRFCSPAEQCPSIDPDWNNPAGVPISAIIFGGRRPTGPPLIYESFDWNHGVFLGASMKSESTTAAEYKTKKIMHDPFGMRPFFGYNFGDYLKHWLSFNKPENKVPKIFHVNWFLKSEVDSKYLWPGFGDNVRVLKWIFDRVEDKPDIARVTPIGYLPKPEKLDLSGLNISDKDLEQLFQIDRSFWSREADEIQEFFDEYVTESTPDEIYNQINNLKKRISEYK